MSDLLEHEDEECIIRRGNTIFAVNLNYREITYIGSVRDKFYGILELYLNHNNITTLDGIDQFFCLKVLSLKFNLISRIEEFLKIKNRGGLQQLNFIGNPVEKYSSYEPAQLFHHFPKSSYCQ